MGCMVLGLGIHIMSFNHIYCRDVTVERLYDDRDVFISVN